MFKIQLCIGIFFFFILCKSFLFNSFILFPLLGIFAVPRSPTNRSEHYFVEHSKISIKEFDFCPYYLTLHIEKTICLSKEMRKCNEILLHLLTSNQSTPAAETKWSFDSKSSTGLDHA